MKKLPVLELPCRMSTSGDIHSSKTLNESQQSACDMVLEQRRPQHMAMFPIGGGSREIMGDQKIRPVKMRLLSDRNSEKMCEGKKNALLAVFQAELDIRFVGRVFSSDLSKVVSRRIARTMSVQVIHLTNGRPNE